MTTTFERIPLDRITPHPLNVRRELGDLTELAASIKGQGLLQAIVVAPLSTSQEEVKASGLLPPQRYIIVAGHRRHAAALLADIETLPCLVRDDLDTPAKVIEAMVTENLQRRDLTVMEEAAAYEQLELLGVKPAAIAKATGRNRATVTSRLKLMALPEKAQAQVDTGQLTLGDAEFLLKHVDDPGLMKAAAGKTGQNLRWAIESELRNRTWEKERAQRAADAAKPKPRETAEAKRQRLAQKAETERLQARRAAIETSHGLQQAWIRERIAAGDTTIADQLTRVAVLTLADHDTEGEWFTVLGIAKPGDDDDLDDHRLLAVHQVTAWPIEKARLCLALYASDVVDGFVSWRADEILDRLRVLTAHAGYQPSDAELALLNPQAPA